MGQSGIRACGLALGVLLAATVAKAAEAPLYAPIPAWVKPAPLPTGAPLDNTVTAVRTLLHDTQISEQPGGLATYTAYARKIETPQGLISGVGPVIIAWNPDIETITLHHVRIRRGGAVIDLLKNGKAVSILRRENRLEYRTLDGVLSATVQLEGVEVGDIIEVAYTSVESDPNLGGHVQAVAAPTVLRDAQSVNFRAVLPKGSKLTWRAADLPGDLKTAGGELILHADDPARYEAPRGAPGRFRMGSRIEMADFASWQEVSAVIQPLFLKARTLAPDSPLKAEIEKIRASSPDPVVQASAALALVEDKVRYFLVTLDNGGYRPATADETWARRYGDCKAKTVLLLALLDGLGIKAEAALVSTQNGDGLDQRLAMPGAFDHVIVRARIGDRTYWLDGTRSGDVSIKALTPPAYAWALPLVPGGQGLEPILRRPLDRPMAQVAEVYDASAGVNLYATAHYEITLRDDAAYYLKAMLAIAPPTLRDDTLKTLWTTRYPTLRLAGSSAVVDPASGDLKLTADGQMMLPWIKRGETARAAELAGARMPVAEVFDHYPAPANPPSPAAAPAKPPLRHEDAPFAIAFPTYNTTEIKVILPKGLGGVSLLGLNVDRTLAGKAVMRNVSLTDGVVTVRTSVRTLTAEVSAADAKAAKQALTQIAADRVAIVAPEANFSAQKRFDEVWAQKPVTKSDYFLRAEILETRGLRVEALAAADKAVALGEISWGVQALRGKLLTQSGRLPEATAAFDKALATPGIAPATIARIQRDQVLVDAVQGRFKAALTKLDTLVDARPNDAELLLLRGMTRREALQEDGALADFDAAISAAPDNLLIYANKAILLNTQKKPDAAADALQSMTTNNPLNADAYGRAADFYYRMGRTEQAQAAIERSLILKPSAEAYILRAHMRPHAEAAQARADIETGLALDASIKTLTMAAEVQTALKDYDGAIRTLTTAMSLTDDLSFPAKRVAAYEAAGQHDLAAKEYAAVRAKAAKNASALNSLCWAQATANITLTRALSDCDAALGLQRTAAFYDSRGLVLLRLGRNADAIAAYDLAVDMSPKQAPSLYGRGLAKLAKGDKAQGLADMRLAADLQPTVARDFSILGLEAPAS